MAGAELLGLQHPDERGIGERGADALGAVAVHDDGLARGESARGIEHVTEQRPAGERMQYFRQLGVHALAQARRENDDVERHALDSARNSTLLSEELASAFARVALANTEREYPRAIAHLLRTPQDELAPRKVHPAFF